MEKRVRAVYGFKSQSDLQLIAMGEAIIAGMTGNPAFPAPPVEIKAAQAAVDALKDALAAMPFGGKAATAIKNAKREAMIVLFRRLKNYAEDSCGNELAVLLSSGFQAASSTQNRGPLENPSIAVVAPGNSGELVLKVTPIVRARSYEVRSAVVAENSAPGPWQGAGVYTNSQNMSVTGLKPGMTYMFQVRAVGGSAGYSDWSNPVSRICS